MTTYVTYVISNPIIQNNEMLTTLLKKERETRKTPWRVQKFFPSTGYGSITFPEFGRVSTHSVACADTVSDPLGGSHVAAIDDARWKRGTQRMASHSVTAGEANMWK